MALYRFCSGNTQASVIVTANFGSCSEYREYNDGTCLYQTWSRGISFTFSGAHPALSIRWRFWQEYYQSDVLTWSGWITTNITVPANSGAHTYSIPNTQEYSAYRDCHEKRYCNFTDGNTLDYPTQV